MERPLTPTDPRKANLSLPSKPRSALALHENEGAQTRLDALLVGCFTAQKLYGRDPGSLEAVNQVFHSVLGRYPGEQVVRAFEIWVERSQEFPTPADIVGLIRRRGKPPLSREMYIAISRKDGEDRSGDEWQYLRDYEAEQLTEDSEFPDTRKDEAARQENRRLRDEVRELRVENERLVEQLREARGSQGLERPQPSREQKIRATAKAMRDAGAPEADIEAFLAPYPDIAA